VHRPNDPAAYARKVLANRRRSLLRRAGSSPGSWPARGRSGPTPPGPRRGRALAVRGVLAVVVALALAAGIPRLLTGRTAGRLGDLAGLERGRHLCHRLAYHRPPEQACPRAGS
jgi:hypothetical protein